MIAHFKTVNQNERKAIIKQVDSFLEVISKDEKIFWLKLRMKLVNLNEPKVLFRLGRTLMTIETKMALEESNQLPMEFLAKHQTGDFGIIKKEDWRENELSIKQGFRIFSAYMITKGEKLWIITEADRSSTTILLPSEY